jgi:ketosteroid isomerase-like protein
MRLILSILLLAIVAAPLRAQAENIEAEREAIRKADLELARAVADRQLDRFLELVGEDALFFGRDVSRGRAAVAKDWGPLFTDRGLSLKWSPTQVEVAQCADMGYSVGSYERVAPDTAGKPAVTTGTYVTIWRKQPDGRWRAVLDAGTPGVPKPSASAENRIRSPLR